MALLVGEPLPADRINLSWAIAGANSLRCFNGALRDPATQRDWGEMEGPGPTRTDCRTRLARFDVLAIDDWVMAPFMDDLALLNRGGLCKLRDPPAACALPHKPDGSLVLSDRKVLSNCVLLSPLVAGRGTSLKSAKSSAAPIRIAPASLAPASRHTSSRRPSDRYIEGRHPTARP